MGQLAKEPRIFFDILQTMRTRAMETSGIIPGTPIAPYPFTSNVIHLQIEQDLSLKRGRNLRQRARLYLFLTIPPFHPPPLAVTYLNSPR